MLTHPDDKARVYLIVLENPKYKTGAFVVQLL